jgi:hypothetical protein
MHNIRQCLLQNFQPLRVELWKEKVEPVTLASGLARLATRPVATASPLIAITMGIVQILKRSFSAFDPSATLAVHYGNGFDAGFSPYQSTRLSR